MPTTADLNLLVALNALLAEGSVSKAAERLALSESAMSRTLARLRESTGDELLVRAGRAMVLTPRAQSMREQVMALLDEAGAVLRPQGPGMDPGALKRTFTLRANDGFTEAFAHLLVARAAREAPGVRLRFAPKPDKDVRPLREGLIDLDIGVLGRQAGPEVRIQALYRDHFVAVARRGHPLLAQGGITAGRYAGFDHVVTSRRGRFTDQVDDALAAAGLTRKVAVVVPNFRAALSTAAATDMMALIPASYFGHIASGAGLVSFEPPVPLDPTTISQMWHPRLDRDPAHRWLRELVLQTCRQQVAKAP